MAAPGPAPAPADEHARLALELASARENLRSLVDACPVATLTLDLQMNVTVWNPAAEAMFGWTAAEVLGRPYPIVPRGELETFAGLFRRVISGEGFTGVEGRRVRKDGSFLDLRIHTTPMRAANGEVVGALALLEDLTEARRLEAQVRNAQKMEAIGRLAGGVAHDFNNVLMVILGMTDILLGRADEAPPVFERGLTEIQRAAERARALTAQLLAFARRQVVDPVHDDLRVLVGRSVPLLGRLAGDGISLRFELGDEPLPVRVDASRLDQVVMNLVQNARDACAGSGVVVVRLGASPADELGGPYACLEVEDDGCGIPEEAVPHLFEPFFTTKPDGEGAGLGLATVYAAVAQAGGRIDVRSAAPRGSVFRVQLPRCEALPPRVDPIDSAAGLPRGEGRTVLLVEDDVVVRLVLAQTLESLGYAVVPAEHGADALARLRTCAVDVVLTDLAMPVMSGDVLVRRMAEEFPTTPVVTMSANLDVPELFDAAAAGRVTFLQKPIARADLANTLAASCATRRGTLPRMASDTPSPGGGEARKVPFIREGAGRPIVLLHGWMASGRVFDALVPALVACGFECIRPDQRGSGAAAGDPGPFDLETQAGDILALLDELALGSVVLVGHSMGGQVAQRVAAAQPSRCAKLALVAPVPACGLELPEAARAAFAAAGGDPQALGGILDMATLRLPAHARAALVDDALRIEPEAIRAGFEAFVAGFDGAELARIHVPTMVISTDDPFLPRALLAAEVTAKIAGATQLHVSDVGHYPQLEATAELAQILAEFARH